MPVFYEPTPVAPPPPLPPAPDPRNVVVRDGHLIDKKMFDELEKTHGELKKTHGELKKTHDRFATATIILSIVAAVLLGLFLIAAASCSNVEKKLETQSGNRR